MRTRFLFPNWCKKVGWVLMTGAVFVSILPVLLSFFFHIWQWHPFRFVRIFAFYNSGFPFPGMSNGPEVGFFKVITYDIGYTLFNLVFISGSLLVAFATEKNEDEYINRVRLDSLLWAVYINFIGIIIADVAIYGFMFLQLVVMLNLYSIPLIFIARFNYVLIRDKRILKNEK
jgi:hypothetical protein